MHPFRICLVYGLILTLTACGTPPVRPDHLADPDKGKLGRVVVIVRHSDPAYAFEASTQGEGAAKGAAEGSIASINCLVLVIICLPVFAAGGAIWGANQPPSADVLASSDSRLKTEIRNLAVPQQLHDAVAAYVRRTGVNASVIPLASAAESPEAMPVYGELAGNADLAVEVRASRIEASASGKDLVVVLAVSARVRLINTRNGQVLDDFVTTATPHARKIDEWLERGAAGISESVAIFLNEIAEAAIDESLFIYHPQQVISRSESGPVNTSASRPVDVNTAPQQKELVPGYTLRAVFPPFRNKIYSGAKMNIGHLEYYRLPDLQPTFEWEHFPRDYDVAPGNEPGEARNLLYDFRLYEGMGVAYERTGLKTSRHQVEDPLPPCRAYRWTARATFELNGTPRATEWTGGYSTQFGSVGPWEWRRGKRTSIIFLAPNQTKYPIVMSPASNGGPCPGD